MGAPSQAPVVWAGPWAMSSEEERRAAAIRDYQRIVVEHKEQETRVKKSEKLLSAIFCDKMHTAHPHTDKKWESNWTRRMRNLSCLKPRAVGCVGYTASAKYKQKISVAMLCALRTDPVM